MEESRKGFIHEVQAGEETISALCRKYKITRATGYKWLNRAKNGEGVSNRSRAPFHTPCKTRPEIERKIVEVREAHPAWGARKINAWLKRRGEEELPTNSTVCAILKRNGYVSERASLAAKPFIRFERAAPNELWQVDFKGHIGLKDGTRCHPLTALDDHTRFSLCVDAKPNERYEGVRESFLRMFRAYGIPESLLCDNGNPWGTSQSTGYTRFEVWLMDIGVLVIHGRPLHPQTQGKQERFNRILKEEALKGKVIGTQADAQQVFDEFRACYNYERPHEALGLAVPASRYRPSPRIMPETLREWEYPGSYTLRTIKSSGYLTYNGQGYFMSEAFAGKMVGLAESKVDGLFEIHYREFIVGSIDLRGRCFVSRRIRLPNQSL